MPPVAGGCRARGGIVTLAGIVARLEDALFAHRGKVLAALVLLTVVMGAFAAQLRMSAGFDKQLPQDHEYIRTFYQYRDLVFGANRIVVVVRQRNGDLWNAAFLKKLNEVTQAVMFLPGVDRRTVTSLWTPTTRVLEITEEGFQAEDVIGGNITPDALDPEKIARIAQRHRRRLCQAARRQRQFRRDGRRRPAGARPGHAEGAQTSTCG
jgi:hypothetical protein